MTELNIISPIKQTELLAHQAKFEQMITAYQNNKLHHAWLIVGNNGVGKATLAYRFARYILSEKNENYNDLNTPTNLKIISDNHPDLLTIKKQINSKSGQITLKDLKGDKNNQARNLFEFLNTKSQNNKWRIIIIDESWRMNISTQNAILKKLEEPPKNVIFLILTNSINQLLPTISSRCQILKLNPIKSDVIIKYINSFNLDISILDIKNIALLSDGSMGKALHLITNHGIDMWNHIITLINDYPNIKIEKISYFKEALKSYSKDENSIMNEREMFITSLELLSTSIHLMLRQSLIKSAQQQGNTIILNKIFENSLPQQWINLQESIHNDISILKKGLLNHIYVYMTCFNKFVNVINNKM